MMSDGLEWEQERQLYTLLFCKLKVSNIIINIFIIKRGEETREEC